MIPSEGLVEAVSRARWASAPNTHIAAAVLDYLASHPSERERLFGDREKALREAADELAVLKAERNLNGTETKYAYGVRLAESIVRARAARPSVDDETPKESRG